MIIFNSYVTNYQRVPPFLRRHVAPGDALEGLVDEALDKAGEGRVNPPRTEDGRIPRIVTGKCNHTENHIYI